MSAWAEIKDASLKSGFAQIPNVIMRDPDLSMQSKCLYGLLLGYAWQDEETFPGLERLREVTGSKIDTIRKYLKELEKAGLLKIVQRGLGKTNKYVFLELSGRYDQPRKGANRTTPKEVVPDHPQRGVSGIPSEGGTTNTQSNEYSLDKESPTGADAPKEGSQKSQPEKNIARRYTSLTVDRTREVGFEATPRQIATWGSGWKNFATVDVGRPPSPAECFERMQRIVAKAAEGYFLSVEKAGKREGREPERTGPVARRNLDLEDDGFDYKNPGAAVKW